MLNDVQYVRTCVCMCAHTYVRVCLCTYKCMYVEGIVNFVSIARANKQLIGCT